MTDALPFVIGVVITFVLVRWIFYNKEGEGARTLSREAFDQLSTMFPNVPPAILRAEYIRAGSVPGAIERLLVVSANYPARPQENARVNSPLANPPKNSLGDILKDIDKKVASSPLQVDSTTWSNDRTVREQLLLQRKQEMLLKARKKFSEASTQ